MTKQSATDEAERIRRSSSLAKQPWSAAALAHIAADEACGRSWVCQCGACRQARGALGMPVVEK